MQCSRSRGGELVAIWAMASPAEIADHYVPDPSDHPPQGGRPSVPERVTIVASPPPPAASHTEVAGLGENREHAAPPRWSEATVLGAKAKGFRGSRSPASPRGTPRRASRSGYTKGAETHHVARATPLSVAVRNHSVSGRPEPNNLQVVAHRVKRWGVAAAPARW